MLCDNIDFVNVSSHLTYETSTDILLFPLLRIFDTKGTPESIDDMELLSLSSI